MVKLKYLNYVKDFNFHDSLCYFCLRRNFPDLKQDNKKKISDCLICQGIFYKINEIVKRIFYIVDVQEKYDYHSFSIGTSLPYFMFDKEDYSPVILFYLSSFTYVTINYCNVFWFY